MSTNDSSRRRARSMRRLSSSCYSVGRRAAGVTRCRSRQAADLRPAVRLERPGDDTEGRTAAVCAAHHPTRGRVSRSSASAKSQRAVPGRRPAADPANGAVPRAASVASSEAVAGRRAHPAAHVLFAPGDARCTAESDSGVGRTSRARHDAALHAPQSGGARQCDSPAGSAAFRTEFWRHFGDGEGSPKEHDPSGPPTRRALR